MNFIWTEKLPFRRIEVCEASVVAIASKVWFPSELSPNNHTDNTVQVVRDGNPRNNTGNLVQVVPDGNPRNNTGNLVQVVRDGNPRNNTGNLVQVVRKGNPIQALQIG